MELERELLWEREQHQRLKDEYASLKASKQAQEVELTDLRVKLGGIQAEIRAAKEVEQLRSEMALSSVRNQMEFQTASLSNELLDSESRREEAEIHCIKLEKICQKLRLQLEQNSQLDRHSRNVFINFFTMFFLFSFLFKIP